jgi:signal transduction histidine kinase
VNAERDSLELARELAAATSDPRAATVLAELADELETLIETQATIGFDLHDGPLQSLAAVRLDVELFRAQVASLADDAPGELPLLGRIADIGGRLSALEVELRDLAVASTIDPGTTLTTLIADVAGQAAHELRVELRLDPELDRLPIGDRERVALARVIGAAVANSSQHSGARAVVVTVRRCDDDVEVEVVDAGTGFDVAGVGANARGEGRLGLAGMEERVRRLGGELQVESVPGSGTSVHARLPLL